MRHKPRYAKGYLVEIQKHQTFKTLGNGHCYETHQGEVIFSTIGFGEHRRIQEQVTIRLTTGPTVIVQIPPDQLYITDRPN